MPELPGSDDVARVRTDKARVLATVANLAAEHGIRVLAAGGPVFAAQGLISPRLSRSASVIIDIASLNELVSLLFQSGWTVVPLARRTAVLPSVALALKSHEWVVKLDVYTAFPGFYVDPQRVFAILWARRQVLTLYGTKVMSLDRLATVILAVHDRVGPQSWSTKAQSYAKYQIDQFRQVLGPKERTELYELVLSLHALEPMRPLLGALGIDAGEIMLPNEVYARWRLAVPFANPATCALLALIECPPPRRLQQSLRLLKQTPGTVVRAILGSPKAFWVVLTSRQRMRVQYRAIRDSAG